MSTAFKDKAVTSVVVVEPVATVRHMIVDVLKNFGFERTNSVNSLKEALHYLETEVVDWIITPLLPSDEVNALHVMQLITRNLSLKRTKISLLVEPDAEFWAISKAFELGLLSWHRKSYIKENIQSEIEEFCTIFEMNQWNNVLVAAEYLRSYLAEQRQYESRGSLEQNLLSLYPGNPKIILALAECEFLKGNHEKAAKLVDQTELLNSQLAAYCKKLKEKFLGTKDVKPSNGKPPNILGLKKVIVIDPDTDILHACDEMLTKVGCPSIEKFEDGMSAAQWITASPEPDLIVMEWRISGLMGPILVQRIRNHGFLQVPIIVASSLVKKDERILLKEMGCDDVLEKPFDSNSFYSTLIYTLQQNRAPTEQKSLQRKIRTLLENKKISEGERLIAHFIQDERVTSAAKSEIQMDYKFYHGQYERAAELGAQALQEGGDSLYLLNQLGKCFLHLKKFETSLKCFERAQSQSPMNVERLFKMADISLRLGNEKDAKNSLQKVEALDPTNPETKMVQCKYELEHGSTDNASNIMNQIDSAKDIVSFMNNRAVALSRAGRFEEGITLYKRTLATLPKDWEELVYIVEYNLALAYTRYGEYENALGALAPILVSSFPITKKAKALEFKINKHVSTGTSIFQHSLGEELVGNGNNPEDLVPSEGSAALDSSEPAAGTKTTSDEADRLSEFMAKIEPRKGDLCLYLVYQSLEGHDERVDGLLKSQPHFIPRDAIQKTLVKPS